MDQPIRSRTDARSEVAPEADFSIVRYAQCWEDTDVLLEALAIQPGDACFSIGSGGDNSLSMLSRDPGHVLAVDLSPAQVALIELKARAFELLPYAGTLELAGVAPSTRRLELYRHIRTRLSTPAREYWDARPSVLEAGVSACGKFEHYFELFRRFVLPLAHSGAELDSLYVPRNAPGRRVFFDTVWNNRRWRALTRLFYSRAVMGRFGRDPRFFRYVEGEVATRMQARVEHALVDLDPATNPYLRWITHGEFANHLPYVWRRENFEAIRRNIGRLELRVASVEAALAAAADRSFDRFNLSDVFEYIAEDASDSMFDEIARCARPGARIAYWNMMAPRRRPPRLANRLHTLEEESARLHRNALTFFYGAFEIDEARPWA